MTNKTCGTCRESKPAAEFNKNKGASDGLQYKCRKCQANYFKQWCKNNPERVRERSLEGARRLLERRPDYFKEYGRAYYKKRSATEEGKEKYRRAALAWLHRNKAKKREMENPEPAQGSNLNWEANSDILEE